MKAELQDAAEKDLDGARESFRQKLESLKLQHENELREQRNAINAG